MSPCDTKVLYDTEFEAEVAAAKHRTAMEVYKCGTHYHLTHADPTKRIGHGNPDRYRRCPHCKLIYQRTNSIQSERHFNGQCLTGGGKENSNEQSRKAPQRDETQD
jgi:hypothetical protein